MTDAAALRSRLLSEVDAAWEEHREEERRCREALATIRDQSVRLKAEHRAAVAEAVALGEVPPGPPDHPDGQPYQDRLLAVAASASRLGERAGELLAEAEPEISAAWQEVRPELQQRAQEAARMAEEVAATVQGWHVLLRDARQAVERRNGARVYGGPSERMRERVTPADVIGALADGVDVLEPAPLPPREQPGPWEPDTRTLRVRNPGSLGW